jgi:hypothetical protein
LQKVATIATTRAGALQALKYAYFAPEVSIIFRSRGAWIGLCCAEKCEEVENFAT